jgi:recombination protein RecR
VEPQSRDQKTLEKPGAFHGVYHVLLGRLSPLSGSGPDQLTVDALVSRVQSGAIQELIMATNPNLEGDGTALWIANRLGQAGVRITRLARGLASGSTLEFANRDMLTDALNGRQPF